MHVPTQDGFEAPTQMIKEKLVEQVVIFFAHSEPEVIRQLTQAGAHNLAPKTGLIPH